MWQDRGYWLEYRIGKQDDRGLELFQSATPTANKSACQKWWHTLKEKWVAIKKQEIPQIVQLRLPTWRHPQHPVTIVEMGKNSLSANLLLSVRFPCRHQRNYAAKLNKRLISRSAWRTNGHDWGLWQKDNREAHGAVIWNHHHRLSSVFHADIKETG